MTYDLDQIFLHGEVLERDPITGITIFDCIFEYFMFVIGYADLLWEGSVLFTLIILLTLVFSYWGSLSTYALAVPKSVSKVVISSSFFVWILRQLSGIRSSSDAHDVYSTVESSIAMAVAHSLPGRVASAIISWYFPVDRAEVTLIRIALSVLVYVVGVCCFYPWICTQLFTIKSELGYIFWDIDWWQNELVYGDDISHLSVVFSVAVIVSIISILWLLYDTRRKVMSAFGSSASSHRPTPPSTNANEPSKPTSLSARSTAMSGDHGYTELQDTLKQCQAIIAKQRDEIIAAKRHGREGWDSYDEKKFKLIVVEEENQRLQQEHRTFKFQLADKDLGLRHARKSCRLIENKANRMIEVLQRKVIDLSDQLEQVDERKEAETALKTKIADLESKLAKSQSAKHARTKAESSKVPATKLPSPEALAKSQSEQATDSDTARYPTPTEMPSSEALTKSQSGQTCRTCIKALAEMTHRFESLALTKSESGQTSQAETSVSVTMTKSPSSNTLTRKVNELELKLVQSQAAEGILMAKIESLATQLASSPSVDSLQPRIADLNAQLTEQTKHFEEARKREAASEQLRLEEQLKVMEELVANNAKLEKAFEREEEMTESAFLQVDRLQAQLEEELQAKKTLEVTKARLERDMAEQFSAKDGLRKDRDELGQQLGAQSQAHEALQKQVADLQNQLAAEKKWSEETRRDIESYHQNIALGKEEFKTLSQQLKQANAQAAYLKRMCADKDRNIEKLARSSHKAKEESVTFELAVQSLEQDIKDAEKVMLERQHRIQDLEFELEMALAAPGDDGGQGLLAKAQPSEASVHQQAIQDIKQAYEQSLEQEREEAKALCRHVDRQAKKIGDLETKLGLAMRDLTRSGSRETAARQAIDELKERLTILERAREAQDAPDNQDTAMSAADPQDVDKLRQDFEAAKAELDSRGQQCAQAERTINTLQNQLKKQEHSGSIATALAKCQVELSEKTTMVGTLHAQVSQAQQGAGISSDARLIEKLKKLDADLRKERREHDEDRIKWQKERTRFETDNGKLRTSLSNASMASPPHRSGAPNAALRIPKRQ